MSSLFTPFVLHKFNEILHLIFFFAKGFLEDLFARGTGCDKKTGTVSLSSFILSSTVISGKFGKNISKERNCRMESRTCLGDLSRRSRPVADGLGEDGCKTEGPACPAIVFKRRRKRRRRRRRTVHPLIVLLVLLVLFVFTDDRLPLTAHVDD